VFGFVVRYAFYKYALSSCGENVVIDFGTVFYFPKISIGNNVTFGIGNIVQHCNFGNNVLVSDSCRFIGGTKKHTFESTGIPINRQGGFIKKIAVEDDTWIDSNAIIMETVGRGSIVKAGSVVLEKIEPYSICSGNPAAVVGKRK
jgi:acetyltransferase-like isoleucine patch superfamily enzyme